MAVALSPTNQFIENFGLKEPSSHQQMQEVLAAADPKRLDAFNHVYSDAIKAGKSPADAVFKAFQEGNTADTQANVNFAHTMAGALQGAAHLVMIESHGHPAPGTENLYIAGERAAAYAKQNSDYQAADKRARMKDAEDWKAMQAAKLPVADKKPLSAQDVADLAARANEAKQPTDGEAAVEGQQRQRVQERQQAEEASLAALAGPEIRGAPSGKVQIHIADGSHRQHGRPTQHRKTLLASTSLSSPADRSADELNAQVMSNGRNTGQFDLDRRVVLAPDTRDQNRAEHPGSSAAVQATNLPPPGAEAGKLKTAQPVQGANGAQDSTSRQRPLSAPGMSFSS